jgi:hypothetical protein
MAPGKVPDKPKSIHVINRNRPECAAAREALYKKEQAQLMQELKDRRAVAWERVKREYRKLEILEPPVITRPVPTVKVRDLGKIKAPAIRGEILDAFSGADERYHYLVTDDAIYVMGAGDKVLRRISKKGYDVPFGSSGVRWSADVSWFWRVHVLKEDVPEGEKDPYNFARTDVYDKQGRLWWSLGGIVESISPDGQKAAIDYPEGMGIGYIEKGWERFEDLADGGLSGACVFDDGLIMISGGAYSEIARLDREREVVEKDKVLASCGIPVCLGSLGRAFVVCADYSNEKAQLMVLDSKSKVLSRSWFPFAGNRLYSVDWKMKHLLLGVSRGESVYLDITTGEVLHRIGRLAGVEQPIPLEEFKGTREEHFQHAASLVPIIRKRPLIYRLLLLDGAVLRLRRPYDSKEEEGRKRPILEVVDLAGKVLYTEQIELDRPNAASHGDLPLPLVWKEGGSARIMARGEVKTIGATRGVER